MAGRTVIGTPDEETMDTVLLESYSDMVGIVFNDTFSYSLKFSNLSRFIIVKELFQYSGKYIRIDSDRFCYFIRSPVGNDC